jgi:hypothetical protein
LTSKHSRDLDQLSYIRHALRSVLLCHEHDIEVSLADNILQDLRRGSGVTPFDPEPEKVLEL